MGGFQLFSRSDQPPPLVASEKNDHSTRGVGRFVRILGFDDVLQHKLETVIPFITEKEIKDRGKSDGISKFIVLLQISWFVIQCIARGIEHLPLTQLEIVTLAYAMMNFFVYIFWWDKPRDVGYPIRVYENLTTNYTAEKWDQGIAGVSHMLCNYILGAQDQFLALPQERKVPMFWSGGVEATDRGEIVSMRATFGPSILGIAFGIIHCIAWAFKFPDDTETILWVISCVAMMVLPLLTSIACAIFTLKGTINAGMPIALLFLFLALSTSLYIAARITTIMMAFTTLQSLPSEAFTVVDWTAFIPHI